MYRNGADYDRMARLAGAVYIDYNIKGFPIDEKDVCARMGISLVPYSAYSQENRLLLNKRSESSFYMPPTKCSPPLIFYNDNKDKVGSYGNMRRNIFHEVKHFVCGDTDELPEDDDLADYFGKYFLAPIPYLIVKNIYNINEIVSTFMVDAQMASYILKNICNRKNKYDDCIFDYEKPLLKHFLGEDYESYKFFKAGDGN